MKHEKKRKDGDGSKNTDSGKDAAMLPAASRLSSSSASSSSLSSTLLSSSSGRRNISPKRSTDDKTDSDGFKKDLGGNS